MGKKMLLLVVLVVVCLYGTSFALDPMGPPVAGLKQGQWSVGVDYSYSDMDLKARNGEYSYTYLYAYYDYYYYEYDYDYGSYSGDAPSMKIKAKMNKIYARIGYGIADNWEAFVRLGGANIDVEADPFGEGMDEYDGGNGFAFGFGTKVTLYESGDLRVGALAQMSWAESDAKLSGQYSEYPYYDEWYSESWSAEAELEITEIQIAAGPAYNLMEGVLIYGGPFLHFVDGDVEGKASWNEHGSDWLGWWAWTGDTDVSYDIKERSCFGGYIGAQVEAIEDIAIYAEWQFTGDADAIGLSAVLRF